MFTRNIQTARGTVFPFSLCFQFWFHFHTHTQTHAYLHTCVGRTDRGAKANQAKIYLQSIYVYVHPYVCKSHQHNETKAASAWKEEQKYSNSNWKGNGNWNCLRGGIANFTFPTIPIRNEQCCAVRFRC